MGCILSAISKADFETERKMNKINRDMFVIQGLIGEGGFGKVLIATLGNNYFKRFAIKEIDKVFVLVHAYTSMNFINHLKFIPYAKLESFTET